MHDGIITIKSDRDRLKKMMEFEAERFFVSVPGVKRGGSGKLHS
jgi:hypothetical protein